VSAHRSRLPAARPKSAARGGERREPWRESGFWKGSERSGRSHQRGPETPQSFGAEPPVGNGSTPKIDWSPGQGDKSPSEFVGGTISPVTTPRTGYGRIEPDERETRVMSESAHTDSSTQLAALGICLEEYAYPYPVEFLPAT
jgi:hypothetical protein